LASTVGKKWLDDRTKGLNKTSDPNDNPSWVHNMWSSHIYATGESAVIKNLKTTFAQKYFCAVMDASKGNISEVLSTPEIQKWRGKGKQHMYF
jgi:hypothetical protein